MRYAFTGLLFVGVIGCAGSDASCAEDADCEGALICEAEACVPGCADAAACDDLDACNGVEDCVEGRCEAGTPPSCDDGVACTTDACVSPGGSCESTPNHDLCDPSDACVAGAGCTPRCTVDADCDDGVYCTGAETCPAGVCVPGVPADCDDGIACTVDACDAMTDACSSVADDAACEPTEICSPLLDCVTFPPPVGLMGCTSAEGVVSGDCWTVCRADATSAWISSATNGTYSAVSICQALGYSSVDAYGGTCGTTCGYCGTSGREFYDGVSGCSAPDTLCVTVNWRCVS